MSTFDYVDVPPDVIRLQSPPAANPVRPFTKISTSLPPQSPSTDAPPPTISTFNPTKSLSTLFLSTSLPASTPTSPCPRKSSTALLSTRDPLSIPITTVNFKRFVARVGPVFWLQDRVEEVLMWKRGWKVTVVWISAYAFLCYFPRLVLLLPHAILAAIMLSTYPSPSPSELSSSKSSPAPIAPPPSEGSVDWQANLQAIQNLMGALSDAYDLISTLTPYLTHRSPHTSLLLVFTLLSLFISLPVLPLIPLRPLFFVLGVLPFAWTHPSTQSRIIPMLKSGVINRAMIKGGNVGSGLTCAKYALLKMRLRRWIDNDNLEDRHWSAEMREVELWENERWTAGPSSSFSQVVQDDLDKEGAGSILGMDSVISTGSAFSVASTGTWNKSHLRSTDRAPWTRGRDGWSGVGGDVSSNLTFSLAPGWAFVETEGWRPDAVGSWVCIGDDPVCRSDENGWVYTNDVWADPRPAPLDAWKPSGMTRRRRWVRRVYFDPALVMSV